MLRHFDNISITNDKGINGIRSAVACQAGFGGRADSSVLIGSQDNALKQGGRYSTNFNN
jgi:hypothetical protein